MSALGVEQRVRFQQPVRARWATVRVETDEAVYVGRLYVPETKKRASDVLGDDRAFVYLTEVSIDDGERERFVAVNKRYIRTVRVLEDECGELAPGRPPQG